MKLHRLVVAWGGQAVVGSAVNVLHFDGTEQSSPPVAAVFAAYQILNEFIPNGTTITVPNAGDSISDTTGYLEGVWAGSGGGTVTGNYTSAAAAGVGACVGWTTGGIVTGASGRPHRLRGRTFIVPLSTGAYQSDGTLTANAQLGVTNWANAMQAAGGLAVWHRPTTVGGTNGTSYGVLSGKVRDKVAFLSSRRD